MCGIAGFWSKSSLECGLGNIKKMTSALSHRGPDAEGTWSDETNVLFLGHRRLAILDLDIRSNQPFEWLNRFVITFNGEIYNYIELREELRVKGYFFATDSDTEVLCAAFNEWGTDCLNRLDGMFAFAIYDKRNNSLFCARDRFGEKPFYYALHENNFLFASEMKALWAVGKPKELREQMIYHFLNDNLVEDVTDFSNTFYKGIYQLKPSHYFILTSDYKINQRRYYKPSIKTTFNGSYEEACTIFKSLLQQSIERRLRSDVKVGASLSGGMDSSSIATLMSNSTGVVETFSARFNDFARDEGPYIDLVNNHINSSPNSIWVNGDNILEKIDKLLYHQEEPFQSASINAQYEVYLNAKKKGVKVILDGQGADEYLAGYFKFLRPYFVSLPLNHKRTFSKLLETHQGIKLNLSLREFFQFKFPITHNFMYNILYRLRGRRSNGIGNRLRAYSYSSSPFRVYSSLKENLLYNLTGQGLPKLLRFADRNSMANSIEVRLPFLSHHLVDFIFSLPDDFFFKNGWTKSILRTSIEDLLPADIVFRKDKVGFEAPHTVWLDNQIYSDEVQKAKNYLLEKEYIDESYSNSWNMLMLYRLINTPS